MSKCKGMRLSDEALSVYVGDKNIYQFTKMSIVQALDFIDNLQLSEREIQIASLVLKEIKERLSFLINVGLII